MIRRLAAVDMGTNSTRLLVADVEGDDPRTARVTTPDPGRRRGSGGPEPG